MPPIALSVPVEPTMTRLESSKSSNAPAKDAPQQKEVVKAPRKLKAASKPAQPVEQSAAQPKVAETKARKPRKVSTEAKTPNETDTVATQVVPLTKEPAAQEQKTRKPRGKVAEPVEAPPKVEVPPEPVQAEVVVQEHKPKSKRLPTDKKSKFESQGVGIAPSRVKSVLSSVALNPREARARTALRLAENRPVMPKQVKDGPAPVLPSQGPQKHIAELDAETVAVVAEAEAVHTNALREEYERETIAKWSAAEREQYKVAKVAAKKAADFNQQSFNTSFKAKFYDNFAAKVAADSYHVGSTKYTEWNRATALVNKLCVRLSQGTRDILAAYLDNVVLQYASNAIFNCQTTGKTTVKLEHALAEHEKFDTCVPLAPWLRTLPSYANAQQYATLKAAADLADSKAEPKPDNAVKYVPLHASNVIFKSYVEDLCLYVQGKQKTALNLSTNFKQFCADMVYSAILRVADCLKQNVSFSGVKTISDGLMRHTIECIHTASGINATALMADLDQRLAKFDAFRGTQQAEEEDEIMGV